LAGPVHDALRRGRRVILHYAAGSPHSAAVRIALAEKGVAAEERRVDLARFAQHEPQFLALGSSGQVPVLEHDGQITVGSFAQMLALDEAHPAIALGGDEPVRAQVREWGAFVDREIAPHLAIVRWQALSGRVPASALAGIERLPPARRDLWREAAAGFSVERVARAAQALLAAGKRIGAALEETEWLAGAELTLADIAAYPHLAQFPALGLPVDHAVTGWLERMAERPSVRRLREQLFPLATMGPA
jgi:glutathione S-transferase